MNDRLMEVDLDELQRIFELVCQVSENDEKRRVIDTECGGRETLRIEVNKLVEADSLSGGPWDVPIVFKEFEDDHPAIGEQIGAYCLKEKIGEGGMGVIFLAEQLEPIRRNVALKLIRNSMVSSEVLSRFEAEKQALATFDHANLTKIFDAGISETGDLYFVMEFVDGDSITDYCDQNLVSLEQRIGIVCEVCDAIAHAHAHDIVHRDIKPSNILVAKRDGKAIPKVIDFGIAKLLSSANSDGSEFFKTQIGTLIGTPQYMSPEQACMRNELVDHRSDIYSLGVVLYELVTGTTPIQKSSVDDQGLLKTFDMICEGEIASLFNRVSSSNYEKILDEVAAKRATTCVRLKKYLKSDLNSVVLKSLATERSDRYGSVSEFRDDLERFLNHEPVRALPPSRWDSLRKWVAKNRALSVVSALVLLVSAVSIGYGTYLSSYANRAKLQSTELQQELSSNDRKLKAAILRASETDRVRRIYELKQRHKDTFDRAIDKFLGQSFPESMPLDLIWGVENAAQDLREFAMFAINSFGINSILPEKYQVGIEGPLPAVNFMPFWVPVDLVDEIEMPSDLDDEIEMLISHASDDPSHFPGVQIHVGGPEEMFGAPAINSESLSIEAMETSLQFCQVWLEEQRAEFDSPVHFTADICEVIAQLEMKLKNFESAWAMLNESRRIRFATKEFSQKHHLVFANQLRVECLIGQDKFLPAFELMLSIERQLELLKASDLKDHLLVVQETIATEIASRKAVQD